MRKQLHAFLKKSGLSKATDLFYNPLYNLIMTPIKRKRMMTFYSQFIKTGDLCFDIGANVGNRTEIFVKLGAKVIAVEPQPACASLLQKKLLSNKNAVIVPKAIDSKIGTAELYINPNKDVWTMSSMSKKFIEKQKQRGADQYDSKIEVETTTMDELVKEYGTPRFVKIDVEGFETNVLMGLNTSLAALSFEYTPAMMQHTIECIRIVQKLMPDAKYNYSEIETFKLNLPEWTDADQLMEILKSLPQDSVEGDVYVKA